MTTSARPPPAIDWSAELHKILDENSRVGVEDLRQRLAALLARTT